MIAIDTNLLVYAHRSALAEHQRSRRAIEAAAADSRGWGIAQPTIAEFWSIVTHPLAAGRPSRPDQAALFLRTLLRQGGGILWAGGPGFGERLMTLAADLSVKGPRIFDLQIALTAFDNGATEIWTHDRSFVTLPGLRLVDPLA